MVCPPSPGTGRSQPGLLAPTPSGTFTPYQDPWGPSMPTQIALGQSFAITFSQCPHQSCHDHINFLEEEFVDMIEKGQWTILPTQVASTLPNIQLSPPGVIPQQDCRPCWIGDYSRSGVNADTLPLAPTEAMQFGHALPHLLQHILLSAPSASPVYLNNTNISDGFYQVNLAPIDAPKLALAFPTRPGMVPLVAIPLVLPMGWKNSPPLYCAVTKTITDLTNAALCHPLDTTPQHALLLRTIGPLEARCGRVQLCASNCPMSLPILLHFFFF